MAANSRRIVSLAATLVILGGAVVVYVIATGNSAGPPVKADDKKEEKPAAEMARAWPLYGGSNTRNMINLVERNVPVEWEVRRGEQAKNVKWSVNLGSLSYGGPTFAGGKIFLGTNNEAPRNPRDTDPMRKNPATGKPNPVDKGILMCFAESDGKFLWQHVNDKLPSGQVHDFPRIGVCSAPVIENNRLWYVSNRCEVVCLDTEGLADGNQGVQDEQYKEPTDADVIWRLDMMKDLAVFPHNLAACSPLIAGDIVFVITANGVDEGHINIPAPQAPSFIALNKKTGEVLWKDNSPGNEIMHGQWSNPTYAEIKGVPQVIFPGGDGWLYSFEPKTGKLIWKFDANRKKAPKYVLGGKGERNDFIGMPVVWEDRIYIAVGQDPEHYEGVGHLYCIDPAGKTGDISPELISKDNADPTKRETKANPNSGQVWHYGGPTNNPDAKRDYFFGRTMSTCSIHDGLVYVAELAGYIHCLDAKTGKVYWDHDLKSEVWGSTYLVDGKVFIGTGDGTMFVFKHDKQKEQLAKLEMDEPIHTTPVALNGVLYIMTDYKLHAIQEKK